MEVANRRFSGVNVKSVIRLPDRWIVRELTERD
jgi:hypothetical protein